MCGARSFADVLNVEIKQVCEPVYATARGAAWIAAAGMGDIHFADVAELVQFKRSYAPNPEHVGLYQERFEVFTQVYQQMKGVYKRLNG